MTDNYQIISEIYLNIKKELATNNESYELQELCDYFINYYFSNNPNLEKEGNSVKEILYKEIFNFGPLDELLKDTSINEIMVNGFKNVYIEKNGALEKTLFRFSCHESFMNILSRIVEVQGVRLDTSLPYVDTRLNDGSRVNIIINPATLNGPNLTIRKFNNKKYDLKGLIDSKFLTSEIADFLKLIVERKMNILVSGNTGSGKTTLLNALSEFIHDNERIITIEDAAELELKKEHLISLQARKANVEGKGEITILDLLKNSLRMRPDRIIVGECRGIETLTMLEAMSTGHDGSMSTIHANSARSALKRIETIILLYYNINYMGIRNQIASSIDFIIHTERALNGSRKIIEILEVAGIEGETILTTNLLQEGHLRKELSLKLNKNIN